MTNTKNYISKITKMRNTDFSKTNVIALKKGRNKFRGHILDKNIQYYRMWFYFVRLVIDCEKHKIKFGKNNQYTVKLNKKFYKDWNIYNYLNSTFDNWFAHHIHLFAETEQVSLVKEGEKSDDYLYIKFHKSQRKEDIIRQARTLLKNSKYQVTAKYRIKYKHRYFNIHQQYNTFIMRYLLNMDFYEIRNNLEDWYSKFSTDFESDADTENYFAMSEKKGAWNSSQSMNKMYRRAEQLVLDVAKGKF